MNQDDIKMSQDDARDLFSDALEGELDEAQQLLFDAVLTEDETLRLEYQEFVDFMQEFHQSARKIEAPDLMPGIERKLKKHRRRKPVISSDSVLLFSMVTLVVLLIILGLAFFGFSIMSK